MMATKHNGLYARSMETIVFHCNLRITLSLQKTFTGYIFQIRQWITNSKSAIFVVGVLILKFFFSF